jgi:CPA2 family monovalent cation:H+ antiporter-2
MATGLLTDILIILGLTVAVVYVCHRFRLPTIVGFLITGILAGPHGLGLIGNVEDVEVLAEVGVVMLLFTIGIELSFARLLQLRKSVLMGGAIQVASTILVTFIIVTQTGFSTGESIFIGFLISLSSTAIVLRVLQQRAEVDSPHGSTTLGILIFQDIIIVPMILAVPLLSGLSGIGDGSFVVFLVKGAGILILVVLSARYFVPFILNQITRTRNREVFLFSIFFICFAIAWVTSSAGFSLSIGAFLAGLIISESQYSHEALGNILPFRDIFTSIFFISIGMLLDVGLVLRQPELAGLAALGVMAVKASVAAFAAVLLGLPLRTSIIIGLALCQIGEFSFILSESGVEHGLLSQSTYQIFLAVSVITMAATPLIMQIAPRVADLAQLLPLPEKIKSGLKPVPDSMGKIFRDHLLIIGYGLNGRNLARAASIAGIPYVIVEINSDLVKSGLEKGETIYYGDATNEVVLDHSGIRYARTVVSVINDPVANRRVIELARRMNPAAYLISRTRYVQEVDPLYKLGADEVIPEEFETSIEIFTRVLTRYLVSREKIEELISEVRSDTYKMLRSLQSESLSVSDLKIRIPDVDIAVFSVNEGSFLAGKSLFELDLRKKYGVSVLAIRRDSGILANPDSSTVFYANDEIFALGTREKLSEFNSLLLNPEPGGEDDKLS